MALLVRRTKKHIEYHDLVFEGGMYVSEGKLLFFTGPRDEGSPELTVRQAKNVHKWLGEWIKGVDA